MRKWNELTPDELENPTWEADDTKPNGEPVW
jgi:hypothetical protein